MPTFKSYVDKDGHYISARPSDVGNVTYQIDPPAASFVCDLGYKHQDELPWGIVTPLRAAGFVYTKSQGVDEEPEEVPELDPTRLPKMSANEAEKLLSYLQERGDVPDRVRGEIKSQTGKHGSSVENSSPSVLEEMRRIARKKSRQTEEAEKKISAAIKSEFQKEPRISTEIKQDTDKSMSHLTITVGGLDSLDEGEKIIHKICTYGDQTIDEWSIKHPYQDMWAGTAKAYKTKIPIVRALKTVNEETAFEIDMLRDGEGGTLI